MTGTEPRIKFDEFGRRLFRDTEVVPIEEPISRIPPGRFTLPFIGSEGASALDNYPVAEQRIRTKYGCPILPGRANHRLKNRIMGMTSRVYSRIRNRLGSYFANKSESEYVAAVDAFRPHIAPIEGKALPVGQTDAFYSPGTDARALDEGAIYGTRKNQMLRSLYRSSLRVAERINGNLGKRLKDFYMGMLNKLEDRKHAESTMAHETMHAGIEKTGLAKYLTVEQNEGLTCALTDEVTGKNTTIRGTSYDGFKRTAYRALYNLGFRSASAFITSYNNGRASGRSFAAAYRKAA